MQNPPIPSDELQRLKILELAGLLDSNPDPLFDGITFLASTICATPIAMVVFIGSERQFFKSRIGLDMQQSRRDLSFSAHAIIGRELMTVNDAHSDVRFCENPLVTGPPHVRFYAGVPLMSREGIGLGTISVVDKRVRHLSAVQRKALVTLGRQMEELIETRRRAAEQVFALEGIVRINDELMAAREEVLRADRVQSAFLANMSSQLTTPLKIIIEFTSKLVEVPVDEIKQNLKPTLRKISVSAKHMLHVINELLELARIDAGKVMLTAEEFDVNTLVKKSVETAMPLAKANKNNLDFGCEENLPLMQCDPARLTQILDSILSNACQFTNNGQIVVEVYGRTLGGVMWTVFRVSDTGNGIDREFLDYLFLDFTQADTTLTHKKGNRGLALAICRRFARMIGGDIEVTSQPGRGSAFTLLLPTKMPTHPCSPHERTAEMPAIDGKLAS